jgi:ABC-type antimicrobial peptide transport system permease subunit
MTGAGILCSLLGTSLITLPVPVPGVAEILLVSMVCKTNWDLPVIYQNNVLYRTGNVTGNDHTLTLSLD